MSKVLIVLFPDPVTGYPPKYARDSIPIINKYPDGQLAPTPNNKLSLEPGHLLGSVSGKLGLSNYLKENGHEFIVTSDKDGHDSVFEKHLHDAEIIISQPFWPAYLDAKRIEKAKKLKLVITAGIGSDHVDLKAAAEHNVTVTEVTFSNSISVAEHVVMSILILVRNFITSHQFAVNGGWNIADCVSRSYDLEGFNVGIAAAGRIGLAVLRRLKPFDVKLHYYDLRRLDSEIEKELNLTWHDSLESLVSNSDVVSLHMPLYPSTEHIINSDLLKKFKRGSYLINTARGKLCDKDAIAHALESGQLAGYAGDVWFPQPAPVDHIWRRSIHQAMVPHISGASLAGQYRYALGTLEILESYFDKKPIRQEYLIVDGGNLAGTGSKSYKL